MTSAPAQQLAHEQPVGRHLPRPQRTLPALTTARFVAAFQVVLFHCTGWASWPASPVRTFASTGYVAVGFFFILSGFILTYTYWESERGPIQPRSFYKARFARIYPLYAAALLVAMPFYAKASMGGAWPRTVTDAMLVITLLQAHVPTAALAWNPPGWSLSTEAFFYLCFPVLMPWLTRGSVARAQVAALLSMIAAIALPAAYLALHPDGLASPGPDALATWLNVLRYHPIARIPEFVLGICAARFYLEDARLRSPLVGVVLTVTAIAVIAGVMSSAQSVPYVLLHNGLLASAFAMLVLGLAVTSPISRLLSHGWLLVLGESSYALYILHVPVLMAASALVRHLAPEAFVSPWFSAGVVMTSIAASVAAHRWLELPARRRVLRVVGRNT